MSTLAASIGDVAGAVAGVLLGLTGLALAFMGLASIVERTTRRGVLGLLAGGAVVVAGLALVGFL